MANGNPEYLKYSTTDINLRSVEPIFSSNGNIKICLGKRDWTQITPITPEYCLVLSTETGQSLGCYYSTGPLYYRGQRVEIIVDYHWSFIRNDERDIGPMRVYLYFNASAL